MTNANCLQSRPDPVERRLQRVRPLGWLNELAFVTFAAVMLWFPEHWGQDAAQIALQLSWLAVVVTGVTEKLATFRLSDDYGRSLLLRSAGAGLFAALTALTTALVCEMAGVSLSFFAWYVVTTAATLATFELAYVYLLSRETSLEEYQ